MAGSFPQNNELLKASKNLWPQAVTERDVEYGNSGEYVSLSTSMQLDVCGNDVEELIEEHNHWGVTGTREWCSYSEVEIDRRSCSFINQINPCKMNGRKKNYREIPS